MADLDRFMTAIRSGVQPALGGRLSASRARVLQRDLNALAWARAAALAESRSYVILPATNPGSGE